MILEVADPQVPRRESLAVVKVILLPQHRMKGPQPAAAHQVTRVIGRSTDLGTSWEVCTRSWRLGRDLGGW